MADNETQQEAPQIVNPVQVRVDAVEEVAAWLSNIRAPGIFDTRLPFTILPSTLRPVDLERFMPFPKRVRKNIRFTDTAGFVDYFNLFKDAYKPRMFSKIEPTGLSMLCVFDYDGPGMMVSTEENRPKAVSAPQPQWGSHRASISLSYHPDYQSLLDSNDRWFKQEEFALFVEENTHLFLDPDGATMLELAQDLKGCRNANWQSGKRLSNGQVKLEYIETVEARSARHELVVPEYITIMSSIFDGYGAKEFKIAFRWRMDSEGKIFFSYRMLTKLVEREAVTAVREDIQTKTSLPIYNVSTYTGIVDVGTED